jgi:hypothetical protein
MPLLARLAYIYARIYARHFDLGLRAPDALHLAIARRLDATLVTRDRGLATAAPRNGHSRRSAENKPSRTRRQHRDGRYRKCSARTGAAVGEARKTPKIAIIVRYRLLSNA